MRFHIELRFFDDGIDDVSLMARGDFAAETFPDARGCLAPWYAVTIGVRPAELVENGTSSRHKGQREACAESASPSAPGRRRVAVRSGFVHQALALEDAERSVHQWPRADRANSTLSYDQRMRADDELRFAGSNAFEDGDFQLISGR